MEGELILNICFHYYLYQMQANANAITFLSWSLKFYQWLFITSMSITEVRTKFQHTYLLFSFHPVINKIHHINEYLTYIVCSFSLQIH